MSKDAKSVIFTREQIESVGVKCNLDLIYERMENGNMVVTTVNSPEVIALVTSMLASLLVEDSLSGEVSEESFPTVIDTEAFFEKVLLVGKYVKVNYGTVMLQGLPIAEHESFGDCKSIRWTYDFHRSNQ